MDDKITVTDDLGNSFEVEVLDIFNVEGYENKDYILYSLGEEIDENNERAYVSILDNKDDNYRLLEIADNKEWETVQMAIKEASEEIED